MRFKEEAKQLTFHLTLLQVMLNRTEELNNYPKAYVQGIKRAGNMFKEAIDGKLNTVYSKFKEEHIDQSMNLLNLISDKIEEAYEEYNNDVEGIK